MGFLKNIYRDILRVLPDKPAVYLIYFRGYKKILDLKNPQYFGEKIQWLKLYGHLDELSGYVDKYEVRQFVKDTVGEKYLNKLYGVYNGPDDIDYGKLPNRFVLKCTNGSGMVLICKDKASLNKEAARKKMIKWLSDDFYKMKKEPQYRNIKNRIIAEEYLEDESGTLRDYKFYCYDSEPIYYGVYTDRYTDEKIDTYDMYDMSGKKLGGGGKKVKQSNYVLPQDDYFSEMVDVVKKLAKPFQFVRVDLYMVKGNIYFGELTFTDSAGSEPFVPRSFDLEMGKRIKLGRVLQAEQV